MRSYIFIGLLSILSSPFFAQSLIDFDTVAHYSLINTTADATGMQPDAELINVPYADTNGVYCNGIYAFGVDPNGSLVSTPDLTAIYDSSFAVSIEFKLDSMPDMWLPVISVGDSWRYLGLFVRFDGAVVYNFNSNWIEIPASQIPLNQWNTSTIIYTGSDTTAQYWLNGQLIATEQGALVRSKNDSRVSNTHFGAGWTFKGYMRNLTVMSIAEPITAVSNVSDEISITLSPNPTQNVLRIQGVKEAIWHIYDLQGLSTGLHGHGTNADGIDVSNLIPGSYIIVLTNGREQESLLFVRQ